MGQVPPKYFLSSAPYGSSPGANALNPSQAAAQNPQVPLLPPNFQSGGTGLAASPSQPGGMPQQNDGANRGFGGGRFGGGRRPEMDKLFGRDMFG